VLYVPDLHRNLLSVSHLAWHGAKVLFSGEACQVFDRRKSLILEGGLRNNLYIMNMHVADYVTANVASLSPQLMDTDQPIARALTTWLTSLSAPLALWHCHLGHLNFRSIKRMVDEGLVTGMTVSDRNTPLDPCKPCLEGKQTRDVIRKVTTTRAEHVLGHVHTDVCGPLPIPSHHGYCYFVTFIDDSSRFASVSPLREKSEVGKLLKAFISWAELETGSKVKILRSDGGGEYIAGHVKVSRPGCWDWVIELIFTCRTAGLLLATYDLISSSLPRVVARYFFTLLAPSPSLLPLPSPSGTFHSRLLNILLPSSSFCMPLMCSR
jgi:hypothetical protein